MKHIECIICMLLLMLLSACQSPYTTPLQEEIIVEGWIESGSGPVVILTKSMILEEMQSQTEGDVLLPWAKVTVSDGIDSVVLTGGINHDYFPPYVYTTSHMKGEAGKTYWLRVEYGNRVATAKTTIPYPQALEGLRVSKASDSLYQITASFMDNPLSKDYYLFQTRIFNKETRYYPAFLGLIDDELLKGDAVYRHQVQPGIHFMTAGVDNYRPYYKEGDSVLIKFSKIDEQSYRVQQSINEIVAFSSNPAFVTDLDLYSNIDGGSGFWCGYGVTQYRVVIADSIK
ncbi:MAG: DUF4249 family protein [Bacteroidales bacterium]|nr:DUF4249 family protein [Bacteroidales bacterium]MBR0334664.1 DUF4249 family protein [Bacteroidales bacterium]